MDTVSAAPSSAEVKAKRLKPFAGQHKTIHVLDWACKSQRHVARSTFSAELLSAGDAADQGILISHMLHELEHGPMTAHEARQHRLHGGYIPTPLLLLRSLSSQRRSRCCVMCSICASYSMDASSRTYFGLTRATWAQTGSQREPSLVICYMPTWTVTCP